MFCTNVILSKGKAITGSGAGDMLNIAVVETQKPKQSIGRLQRYQEEINRLDVSGQEEKRTVVEIKSSEDYFECLKARMVTSALWVNAQAKDGDVERNRVNYGETIAWTRVMRDLGHKTNVAVWEDENGCLRIPFIEIDGEKTSLEG